MTFTNVSGAGFYLQCCHRTVESGGSFSLPWERCRRDRGLRAAMQSGCLAWVPSEGEPKVPGSPAVPDFAGARRRAAARAAAKEASERAKVAALKEEHSRGVSENMARMGNFDVPVLKKRDVVSRAVETEKPITEGDLLTEGPKSLEALRRHNRAVEKFSVKNGRQG